MTGKCGEMHCFFTIIAPLLRLSSSSFLPVFAPSLKQDNKFSFASSTNWNHGNKFSYYRHVDTMKTGLIPNYYSLTLIMPVLNLNHEDTRKDCKNRNILTVETQWPLARGQKKSSETATRMC